MTQQTERDAQTKQFTRQQLATMDHCVKLQISHVEGCIGKSMPPNEWQRDLYDVQKELHKAITTGTEVSQPKPDALQGLAAYLRSEAGFLPPEHPSVMVLRDWANEVDAVKAARNERS